MVGENTTSRPSLRAFPAASTTAWQGDAGHLLHCSLPLFLCLEMGCNTYSLGFLWESSELMHSLAWRGVLSVPKISRWENFPSCSCPRLWGRRYMLWPRFFLSPILGSAAHRWLNFCSFLLILHCPSNLNSPPTWPKTEGRNLIPGAKVETCWYHSVW